MAKMPSATAPASASSPAAGSAPANLPLPLGKGNLYFQSRNCAQTQPGDL